MRDSRVRAVNIRTNGSSRYASTAASAKGKSTGWKNATARPKVPMIPNATAPPTTMAKYVKTVQRTRRCQAVG